VTKRKNDRVKYPTREEIIQALHDDDKMKDFEQLLVVLEFNRKTDKIGLIKGELLQNDKVVIRGKLTVFPETMPDPSMWSKLKVGESVFYGFSLEYEGEKLFDMLAEGIKNSIRDGRIPFFNR